MGSGTDRFQVYGEQLAPLELTLGGETVKAVVKKVGYEA
jgi:hypothetical protein